MLHLKSVRCSGSYDSTAEASCDVCVASSVRTSLPVQVCILNRDFSWLSIGQSSLVSSILHKLTSSLDQQGCSGSERRCCFMITTHRGTTHSPVIDLLKAFMFSSSGHYSKLPPPASGVKYLPEEEEEFAFRADNNQNRLNYSSGTEE